MSIPLLIHIAAGSLAILTGYVALFAAKGRQVHRRSGIVFVGAMVVMAGTGALIAMAAGDFGTAIGGQLAIYLVVTALTTVREHPAWIDTATLVVGLATGAGTTTRVVQTLARGETSTEGIPVFLLMIFASIALLSCAADIRIMRGTPPRGAKRIRRHLWRMCFAMYIAAGSFFLGQADEFPAALRTPALLFLPAFTPLLVMPYWLWRNRTRRPRVVAGAALPLQEIA